MDDSLIRTSVSIRQDVQKDEVQSSNVKKMKTLLITDQKESTEEVKEEEEEEETKNPYESSV